ncbi:GTP-binding protein [Prevotella copri]|uniref:CobW family GTP-binding protein n=1 Tax=Segatella copri TaxID=165179 RepID=UPI00033AAB01|nr:GTP-binding protein [Segatella copri]MBV3414453.1 GTP-binding protein [Segatella copri]CDC25837.1 cobalamin synthesis protein/P47K family protein [Prevotella sp. CAG:386]
MNSRKEIPVLLLTGYLGSGKTTLLNKILANQKGIKFAVIVNDIGEVNIDAALIEQGGVVGKKDDSLVALQNGCICCTLKMDLVEQLKEIVDMQKFDYIVIEASGICEPAPIAQTICSIPTLGPQYVKNGVLRLDSIVTVVDALRMKDEFAGGDDLMKDNIDEEDLASLVIQQIEFCNIILLNKAAEVEPKDLNKLKHIIKAIQPKAEIFECNYGDVDLDKIVNTRKFDWETVATSAGWIQEIEAERNEDHHDHDDDDDDDEHEHHHHDHDDEHEHDEHEHHHHHDHDHHHHHDDEGEAEEYGIGTFVYYSRKPFDLGLFDDFVARKWPRDVVRAKGICYFADERDMCYVFEQAGKQKTVKQAGQWIATMPKDQLDELLAREEQLRKEWDDKVGDRMIKIVFIGQHLQKEAICKELDKCLVD